MRTLALALALVVLAGCKSGRDYMSANRASREFLRETFQQGNEFRKKNLKETTAFSSRAPANKRVRKESRAFAWEAFWQEEWSGFSDLKHGIADERRSRTSERLSEMRYGFLDSGS